MNNPFVPGLGIFLRDYFAANAPPAPDWFKPAMEPWPQPPQRSDAFYQTPAGKAFTDVFHRGAVSFPDAIKGHNLDDEGARVLKQRLDEVDAFEKATAAYGVRQQREILLQWPLFFADEQLRRRYDQCQPPATINGFQDGDRIELITGPANGIHVATVVGFNCSDPSRPKINVQAHDAKGKLVGRPYDTDPALWKHFEPPIGTYRTPAGRIVQLANTESQTAGCYLAEDGMTIAYVHVDGEVSDNEEHFAVGDAGLGPNAWPLPANALANIDTYLVAREAAARKRKADEPIGDGFDRDIESGPAGGTQADKLVHAVANSTGDDSKP